MRCPNCDQSPYNANNPCPNCQFAGDPTLIEELGHIDWALTQLPAWLESTPKSRHQLQERLLARQYELEVALNLRLPRFSEAEAREAWPDLIRREALLEQTAEWLAAGYTNPVVTQVIVDQATEQVGDLQEQLEGHPRPAYPQTDNDRLDIVKFLQEAFDYLAQHEGFVSPATRSAALEPLRARREQLEVALGLRPARFPITRPVGVSAPGEPGRTGEPVPPRREGGTPAAAGAEPGGSPASPPAAGGVVPPPAPPPVPLLDRAWRTLLSERTLQALLFLGIFLLFSAAISFVVWGWEEFSAPLRVAIPTGFTIIFFALGWAVRSRTHLYRSGIALSAIAALLIPIDFYTVYVNFNIPASYSPMFWLVTSLVCLGAYLVITLLIRSRVFGYLVGTAAGSSVLALIQVGHQSLGVSLDWRTAGLAGLALGLTILATYLERSFRLAESAGRSTDGLAILAEPFHYLALLAAGVLMPLTFGWRYIGRETYDTLHYALITNWWAGAAIFGWGTLHYRSRSLGLLTTVAVPVATYLSLAMLFFFNNIGPAWFGAGWAILVPLYLYLGHRWLVQGNDPVTAAHGRMATVGGIVLLVLAALEPLIEASNGAAGATSHIILAGAVVLAALLWQRPRYLYGASALALSATTLALTELNLSLAQLTVGWASLAIGHIIVALRLGTRFPRAETAEPGRALPAGPAQFAGPVVIAGYGIAALALIPPLYPYEGSLFVYGLGNWLGLAAWGARLAHLNQPGFAGGRGWRKSVFSWLTALPLPVWVWLLFTNSRPADFTVPLALAALAWGMVALSFHLGAVKSTREYRWPWYLTGLLVSVIAPIAAFSVAPDSFAPAMCLGAAGLLYGVDALTNRQSLELAPAGLVIAWGMLLFLDRLHVSFDASSLALAGLIAAYMLGGLLSERGRTDAAANRFGHHFWLPLYRTAHLLTLLFLGRIYVRPFDQVFFEVPWTDAMRWWGGAGQLTLAVVYGLYAWGTYRERWGHLAAWLGAAGGGFIALIFSHGRGSSAAEAALFAVAFVMAERGLAWTWQRRPGQLSRRQRAFFRLSWRLYRRPLTWTGWVVSAGAIGLALIRNLAWLGGGRIQQTWAVVALLLITALYAVSARLFRQARFAWLAAVLVVAPWTILTNLGWFTAYRPTLPGFALSWAILAWTLLLVGLYLERLVPRAYSIPPKIVAHSLVPWALFWGVADVDTSRFTFALGAGFYALVAILDHQHFKRAAVSMTGAAATGRQILNRTKFLYPALGLIPVWSVYLLSWLLPAARHEHYGLMLLAFGPIGLVVGRRLRRIAPVPGSESGYSLPGYLVGYLALIVGTMLVAHEPALLALVLLYDSLVLLVSTWLFKNPLWLYPAVTLTPLSLVLALNEANVAGNRYGWWLIGLASIYLALAWTLRRARLDGYGTPILAVGFALVAFGLPPSSQDSTGAWWGYGGAALLYALSAAWLRQPLLLTPACALIVVPYAISLRESTLAPAYYGLALFPGSVAALALGWGLDRWRGSRRDFPWYEVQRWPVGLADRLLTWWGLPLHVLGLSLAGASPLFTDGMQALRALNFLLLAMVCGWAIYTFRLRFWLLASALAVHLAVGFFLDDLGWWRYPAWAWVRFLPVTLGTCLLALFIEWRRQEGSPLAAARLWAGWSRPLYIILVLDIITGHMVSREATWAGVLVTLTHTLIIAGLASWWRSGWLAGVGLVVGLLGLLQWLETIATPLKGYPVALAQLALTSGAIGYGLALIRSRLPGDRELRPTLAVWELPLQWFSLVLSFGTLVLTAGLGVDLAGWTVRALLGFPFRELVEMPTVQMGVSVLALLGLLYVTVAFSHQWARLGYWAIAMLLVAWGLHAFYVRQWDGVARVQWYAIPAGLYLLGISYLEWQRNNKIWARWLDYAAMGLMLGSLFWQTLLFGWMYALLLGSEGFLAFLWGSARRLRRFFYAGMVGVMLGTLGQLINQLRSVNQWIVFGLIGLGLVVIAIVVERKLEDIKAWQAEVLERWE